MDNPRASEGTSKYYEINTESVCVPSMTRALNRYNLALIIVVCMVFTVVGPVEADPEYQLIVDSNNMIVELDHEISKRKSGLSKYYNVFYAHDLCHRTCC